MNRKQRRTLGKKFKTTIPREEYKHGQFTDSCGKHYLKGSNGVIVNLDKIVDGIKKVKKGDTQDG